MKKHCDVYGRCRGARSILRNKVTFSLVVVLACLWFPATAGARTYTLLHNFSDATGDGPEFPNFLAQGRDGNLYSTTTQGGTSNLGVVFRSTPAGAYKCCMTLMLHTGVPLLPG